MGFRTSKEESAIFQQVSKNELSWLLMRWISVDSGANIGEVRTIVSCGFGKNGCAGIKVIRLLFEILRGQRVRVGLVSISDPLSP